MKVPDRFGLEGTGSYGARLTRYLRGLGIEVVEGAAAEPTEFPYG